jgi:hypothetical protein
MRYVILVANVFFATGYDPINTSTPLRRAIFPDNAHGWTVLNLKTGKRTLPASAPSGLKQNDRGPNVWFFCSAPSFLDTQEGSTGNITDWYGHHIRFELHHARFFSEAARFMGSTSAAGPAPPDLVLIPRRPGAALAYRGAAISWTYRTAAAIALDASAPWLVLADPDSIAAAPGPRADEAAVRTVLADLAEIRVRGGYYNGSEITTLRAVALYSGPVPSHTPPVPTPSPPAPVQPDSRQPQPQPEPTTSRVAHQQRQKEVVSAAGMERAALAGHAAAGRWIRATHSETGRTYYWHSITKQSRWKPPPEDGGGDGGNQDGEETRGSSRSSRVGDSGSGVESGGVGGGSSGGEDGAAAAREAVRALTRAHEERSAAAAAAAVAAALLQRNGGLPPQGPRQLQPPQL